MERVDYQSLVIQDLVNLEKQGDLNLNPWYQRRSVWNDNQKSYLINTLFERKPIPTIYVRHTIDLDKGKSIKEVVDGQQRIRAILSFYRGEISAYHPENKKRIKFHDLNNNQKQRFLMTPIPVGYLQGATDGDVIDIFARINSVAKSLNVQEKRNAKFSGAFKQFCIYESTIRLELFRNYSIFSANDFARMNEVQFMSDLIVNMLEGLTSYNSAKLDKFYERYDDNFDQEGDISKALDRLFGVILEIEPAAIKDTIFRRPPLFFSLLMALYSHKGKVDVAKISSGLVEIDARYNQDQKNPMDLEFINAVSATTQGGKQREIRDEYIKRFIF